MNQGSSDPDSSAGYIGGQLFTVFPYDSSWARPLPMERLDVGLSYTPGVLP